MFSNKESHTIYVFLVQQRIMSIPFKKTSKGSNYLRSCNTLQAGLEELTLQRAHGVPTIGGESKDVPMVPMLQQPTGFAGGHGFHLFEIHVAVALFQKHGSIYYSEH